MARYGDLDALRLKVMRYLMPNVDVDGTVSVEDAERYFLKLLEDEPTADVAPKSEVDKLELTLQGVMWSVDKWLDEADYDADPIKRAITMREKTLQIVENAKTEAAREIFEEIDKRFEAVLKFYPLGGKLTDAKKFVDFHWKHIRHSIMCDYDAELKKKYTEGD